MWEDEDNTPRPAPQRASRISWAAVAGIALSVSVPMCGWLVTLSNRVSSLEVRTESLATSAQMAKVEQRIADWIEAFDRARADERAADRRTR